MNKFFYHPLQKIEIAQKLILQINWKDEMTIWF